MLKMNNDSLTFLDVFVILFMVLFFASMIANALTGQNNYCQQTAIAFGAEVCVIDYRE